MAIRASQYGSIFGFFLVKNAISIDRKTGTGEIIATTQISNQSYFLGKLISNLLVLSTLLLSLFISSIILNIIRYDGYPINVLHLFLPLLFLTFPMFVLISGIAILFERIKLLRTAVGTILFIPIWVASTIISFDTATSFSDPYGVVPVLESLQRGAAHSYPDINPEYYSLGSSTPSSPVSEFLWEGVSWSPELIYSRLIWILIGLSIGLLASLFFDRFDPAKQNITKKGWIAKILKRYASNKIIIQDTTQIRKSIKIKKLSNSDINPSLNAVIMAELRLLLIGQNKLVFLIAIGTIVASLVVPIEEGKQIVWALVWIVPIHIWSMMGVREDKLNLQLIVFSSVKITKNLYISRWVSGLILSFIMSLGVLLRLVVAGMWFGVIALLIGMVFIPSMAIFIGVWTKSNMIFEVIYASLWFIGPIQHYSLLDFMGVSHQGLNLASNLLYLSSIPVFIYLGYLGWKKQAQC
jgi:hypothetical protein